MWLDLIVLFQQFLHIGLSPCPPRTACWFGDGAARAMFTKHILQSIENLASSILLQQPVCSAQPPHVLMERIVILLGHVAKAFEGSSSLLLVLDPQIELARNVPHCKPTIRNETKPITFSLCRNPGAQMSKPQRMHLLHLELPEALD